jgi:hypothetical protein
MQASGDSDSTVIDLPPPVDKAPSPGSADKTWHNQDGILDHWSAQEWKDGIQLESLEELDTIVVRTENTPYEITVLSGFTGEVLVRGGSFFPEWTPTHLAGSSLGGSFLKIRGIYVGYSLEFQHDRKRIVTSRVKSIGKVV